MVKKIFNIAISTIGVVGVVFSSPKHISELEMWQYVVMMGIVLLAIISFFISDKGELICDRKSPKISTYMLKFLDKGGRTVIFTRDMSWADNDIKIKLLLFQKAKSKELEIFVKEHTHLTKKLKEDGANIFEYGTLINDAPKVRFTMIDVGTLNPTIAIGGTTKNDKHIIEETSGDDPVIGLASDLIEIIKRKVQK